MSWVWNACQTSWLFEKLSLKSTYISLDKLKKHKFDMAKKSSSPIVSVRDMDSSYSDQNAWEEFFRLSILAQDF